MINEPYGTWKDTGMKVCSVCQTQKSIDAFQWNKSRKAPSPSCKVCRSVYTKEWNKKNRENIKKSQQKYREKNRDVIRKRRKEYSRKYYWSHKEYCDSRQSNYYKNNKEKCELSKKRAVKKAFFEVGDLVIYKFALYEVMKRTRGGFKIEKRYPWKDSFYFESMKDTVVTTRRSLRRYMIKHHKNNETTVDDRFIPKF